MKKILFPLCIILSACGSGGTAASDDPPDVEGNYSCTEGCNGPDCLFDNQLGVAQTGDDIIITSAAFGDAVGNVNNEGEFSAENDTVNCTGQFVDGIAIADCTADGNSCQQVTFTRN